MPVRVEGLSARSAGNLNPQTHSGDAALLCGTNVFSNGSGNSNTDAMNCGMLSFRIFWCHGLC